MTVTTILGFNASLEAFWNRARELDDIPRTRWTVADYQVAAAAGRLRDLAAQLRAIRNLCYDHSDGAPDAGAEAQLANAVLAIIERPGP